MAAGVRVMSNGGIPGIKPIPVTDRMEVWLWNFSTGKYDRVINVKGNGPTTTQVTVNNASDYIDPNSREVIALYRMVVGLIIVCPTPQSRWFNSKVDYINFKFRYVKPRINQFNRESVLDVTAD